MTVEDFRVADILESSKFWPYIKNDLKKIIWEDCIQVRYMITFKPDTKTLRLILKFQSGSEQIIHFHIYSCFLAYTNGEVLVKSCSSGTSLANISLWIGPLFHLFSILLSPSKFVLSVKYAIWNVHLFKTGIFL